MNSLSIDAIGQWAIRHYDLEPPVACGLMRAYTNDVYAITSAGDRFIVKIYGAGWRTEPEIAYEIDLIEHLASRGVAVARAIAGRDHQPIQRVETPAGTRFAVLFEYAAGSKPVPPFTPELDERVGRAAAALHQAADDFIPSHPRQRMDTAFLLDRPVALIEPLIANPVERDYFLGFVELLRRTIQALADRGLDWGPCHGDLTMDNLHLTGDHQIVWYDFDSGGPGWRAADLPGWAATIPESAPRAEAFLRGYRTVRQLDPVNVEAAPYVYAAFEVWGMEIDLQNRVLQQGSGAVQHYLSESIDRLRRWATDYDGMS